ncbi:MAG: ROK family protein [Bryobacteraceae bacterium]|nr:ROK family protein [Bryobacterales bacterium]MEB2361914.1 ROK family protein [Bryobacterales bacterium]NUN01955.1 ROK family protein [Bryobacteraceae bacterium]
MAEYSIGVDLGGTNLRAAAITKDGIIVEKISGSTNLSEGRDAVISDIVDAITRIKRKAGAGRLAGVGIGVPGFILIEKGIIVGSNNLPEFEGFPVRDEIERRLGTQVILENDANAAAMGEKWMGAGKEVDDLILLTLGTGIGGGIISRGRILHGFVGMAGEIGHMTIYPNGNPCGCGNHGCLEKHASATAVSSMAALLHLGDNVTSEDVYKMAAAGDEKAQMIFASMGTALGLAIGTLVNIFNFPLVLLSGGMLPAWDLFAPPMMKEVERSFTFRNTKTTVGKATLGNEAGLYGAAYLPFQALTATIS